jgi:hypothetical protein
MISRLICLCLAEFAVADITDIEWSSAPFDCLAIPEEQKKMVLALAGARLEKDADIAFDDFVVGKGRGLNVLLQYGLKFCTD